MEVGKVNNSPNFGARIIIQKTGFKNLGKDIADSFVSGTNTTGTVASTVGETTVFPSEISAGTGFSKSIHNGMRRIKEALDRIFGRDIKTSAFDDDMQGLLNSTGRASSGSGMVTTGIGSYGSSLASGLDQSVNYPLSGLGSELIPQYIAKVNNPTVNEIAKNMEGVAFDVLYNEHGFGNETAFIPSALSSASGVFSQGKGFDMVKNANKASATVRNFPS